MPRPFLNADHAVHVAEMAERRAHETLEHYIRLAWENGELDWTSDNSAEVRLIADSLVDAGAARAYANLIEMLSDIEGRLVELEDKFIP